ATVTTVFAVLITSHCYFGGPAGFENAPGIGHIYFGGEYLVPSFIGTLDIPRGKFAFGRYLADDTFEALSRVSVDGHFDYVLQLKFRHFGFGNVNFDPEVLG